MKQVLKIKKLHDDAKTPTYAHETDSGMDLYAVEDSYIYPKRSMQVRTGIAIELPDNTEAQIRSKSGIALKGVLVANSPGTVDQGFTGEIKVILINHSGTGYVIKKGQKIAQMVICPVIRVEIEEIKDRELSKTSRGNGGFGSTGLN